jgi:uncharacterized OsmC-like protein
MTVTTPDTRLNGVDIGRVFATVDAVKAHPAAARFQFRTAHRWISGTHSRAVVNAFYGVGEEQERGRDHVIDSDHPEILVGEDNGPSPAEHLLQALGACLTAGLANVAAARGIRLGEVTCTVEGDIDLRGILGLDDDVRNGFEEIRVVFHVSGDAEAEELAKLVSRSQRRSAVFDVLTHGVPVSVSVATG